MCPRYTLCMSEFWNVIQVLQCNIDVCMLSCAIVCRVWSWLHSRIVSGLHPHTCIYVVWRILFRENNLIHWTKKKGHITGIHGHNKYHIWVDPFRPGTLKVTFAICVVLFYVPPGVHWCTCMYSFACCGRGTLNDNLAIWRAMHLERDHGYVYPCAYMFQCIMYVFVFYVMTICAKQVFSYNGAMVQSSSHALCNALRVDSSIVSSMYNLPFWCVSCPILGWCGFCHI